MKFRPVDRPLLKLALGLLLVVGTAKALDDPSIRGIIRAAGAILTGDLLVSGDAGFGGNLKGHAERGGSVDFATYDGGFSGASFGGPANRNAVTISPGGTVTIGGGLALSAAVDMSMTGAGSDILGAARNQNLHLSGADGGLSNLQVKSITVPAVSFCNSTASSGTGACNGAVSGIGRMGTGDYFTIYNTSMPANAYVEASLGSVDATCLAVGAKIVDGGFGTVLYPTPAACTTADTIVRWRINDSPTF